jgi:hypothetical protein
MQEVPPAPGWTEQAAARSPIGPAAAENTHLCTQLFQNPGCTDLPWAPPGGRAAAVAGPAASRTMATTHRRLSHLTAHVHPTPLAGIATHGDGTVVQPSGLPGRTPRDVRLGITRVGDEAHPLRWGILGAADISADWVRALSFVPGASVAAVAARSGAKAAAWAAEVCPGATVHEGYESLAADPNVDIVYVGTITGLHRDHAMMCVNAGKHVLVEKPLCMSMEESEELYEAAAAKGVMLQEGMWSRFFPATEHARALLEDGAIGDVKFLQADFGFRAVGDPGNVKGDPANMSTHRAIHNPAMCGLTFFTCLALAHTTDGHHSSPCTCPCSPGRVLWSC